MSLAEGVLLIAQEMDDYANDIPGKGETVVSIKHWVSQLRLIVKVAGDKPQNGWAVPMEEFAARQNQFNSPEAQHRHYIEQAKAEFRQKKAVEESLPRQVNCVGGEADGCYAPVAGDMPYGAFSPVAGQAYKLERVGGVEQLTFDHEETARMLKAKGCA